MRKKILFSLASTLTVLSACIFPNNTTILEPKKEESSEDRLKSKFVEQFKNKKDKSIENINISINTELQDNNKETNNVFKVLSDKDNKSTTRNKVFLSGEHPTNESHIKNKDKNILEFKVLKNTKLFRRVA